MKPGDMVKFTERFEKHKGRTFLVLGRYRISSPDRAFPDNSIWAKWAMIDMTTGSIYTQINRDLELVNGTI